MGPNGCGKSTRRHRRLGSPEYEVTDGTIRLKGDDITDWDIDVRAKAHDLDLSRNPFVFGRFFHLIFCAMNLYIKAPIPLKKVKLF